MIRAVLVDDEPPARNRMRQLLEAASDVCVVGEAGSAVEARALIDRTHPDLIFLDVEMPEVQGTALAAELPEPRPFIVFATAFDHYALEAIAVEATDYLLKPVSRTKLAVTLDRVRVRLARLRVEHDVAAASAVQAQMWPVALRNIPGFDCAAASLPARGVGGDFYDIFALHLGGEAGSMDSSSHWALLLGDASGKGVAAGLVASAVQARVNAAARHARLAPAALMAAVDRDVYATTDGSRYATAIYGTLDVNKREFTFVNAGHPALLLVQSGSNHVTRFDPTGPALGLIEAGRFDSHAISLTPGSIILAVSDGVTEAESEDGAPLGDDALARLLLEHRRSAARDICDAVLAAVRAHRGSRQDQDDVTAMVIRAADQPLKAEGS
jgi:serine phosphatase RsbU (regulator of sigma subunit)